MTDALRLVNAVSRLLLGGPRQIPTINFDGHKYIIDVYYFNHRYHRMSDDLPSLLFDFAAWSETKLQEHIKQQELIKQQKNEQEKSNQL